MVTIRRAGLIDAPELAELVTELGYPVEAPELAVRLGKMPAETYETLVALVDRKIVGFMGLLTLAVYEHSRPIGWILALSVAPKKQRQGIGSALLQAAEIIIGRSEWWIFACIVASSAVTRMIFMRKAGFHKSGYRFRKTL